jgi:hypothetical protein
VYQAAKRVDSSNDILV